MNSQAATELMNFRESINFLHPVKRANSFPWLTQISSSFAVYLLYIALSKTIGTHRWIQKGRRRRRFYLK